MMMSKTVKIEGEKPLSAEELIRLRHAAVGPIKLGQKRVFPTHTEEEEEELKSLYEQLSERLSVPRIDRLAGRALAVWDKDAHAVHVQRKDGKFGNFGFSRDGKHYLEYFEALYLLEMNRLQLEYHSMVMSIEQAYLLLLGEEASPKYNEYLVYSHMLRAGYILVKHQNLRFTNSTTSSVVTKSDCIWEILLNAIQNKPIPEHVKHSAFFAKTKDGMDNIKTRLVQQNAEELPESSQQKINFDVKFQTSGKRKTEDRYESAAKRLCTSNTQQKPNGSLVDFLTAEPEYKQLEEIFQRLNVIQLNKVTESEESTRNLHINFDVHLHNSGFRKSSPNAPAFRIIVLDTNESFPNHAEISLCHQQQLHPVPLIVASVNESKQVHAFLYHFSS